MSLLSSQCPRAVALLVLLVAGTAPAWAEEHRELAIRDHVFEPAELHVPANTPVTLRIRNLDGQAEEFDSQALKVEKVISGSGEGIVRLRPLAPGRYNFVGEYHEKTAHGTIVAE
jgi:hypothetical protein